MKSYIQYIFVFLLISTINFAQSELLEYQVRDKSAISGEIKIEEPEALTGIIKYEEIFNSATPPAGWTVIDNDESGTSLSYNDTIFFTGATVLPEAGDYFWFSNFGNANSSGVIDEWLISPILPTIDAGDMLNFYAGAIGGSFDDSLKVLISTTDANPGSFSEIAYFKVDGPVGSWTKYSFDLTAYAGSQIYVAVNYYIVDGGPSGTHSDNVWIDHFSITSPGARLQVVHNAADIAADPVVVYLNGDTLLSSFAFREATPFIDAPADVPLNIGIGLPGGTVDDTLKNFTETLADGETYIAFANGVTAPGSYASNPDGRSTAFDLLVKPMARETASASGVDFFVLHGATDAPTVDVIARGVATLVNDAAYGDITPYISVPAGAYTLDLTLADGTTLVQSYIADLSTLGGGSAAVFASGFLTPSANQNGESFGIFFALADGTVGEFPSGVVPVELTSFAASISGSSVNLNWTTATETNNRGFEIERKYDKGETSSEWQTIGFISGNGTTAERSEYTYQDNIKDLTADRILYRLKQIDFDGTFDYSNELEIVNIAPSVFSLEQNYPNPFNPSTTIKFSLPKAETVTLKIFNILGSEVATLLNETVEAGSYDINFNASDLSSGVYLYELRAGSFTQIMKMNLIK